MISKIFIGIVLLLLVPHFLFPQTGEYQLNLFKDNLSWMWFGGLNLDIKINSKTQFVVKDQFTSNLFLETVKGNKWRDENNFKGYLSYDFSDPFKTSTQFSSRVFSDENSFVKFSKHIIFQQIDYYPISKVKVAPALGWASEDIYSIRDQGWYSQINSHVNGYDLGGYTNTLQGFSSLYYYPNRKNQEHRYFTAFNKQFSELARDSLQIGYEFIDNSYPIPSIGSGNIVNLEDVGINSRYLYNELDYKFSSLSNLTIETKIQTRDITQSSINLHNHRKELNFANRVAVRYGTKKLSSGFIFSTSQETTLSSRKPVGTNQTRSDIDGLQSAFHLFLRWRSTFDESRLSFSYTKYEYSSPDTSQTVDEDDLRFIIDLMYRHIFSDYFSIKINANLYLYHQIYIHPSRSANNNWNRIYVLASSFIHTIPERVRHSFQIKILANYTVYDFEDILPEIRSYLFRKLDFSDSLQIQISNGLKFQTIYQLEKEDNGTFFKDIFAQQISRELTSHFIDVGLLYAGIKGLQLNTALNWHFRKEWSMAPDRRLVRDYRAFSPRVSLKYGINKNLFLFLIYSPRSYRDLNIKKRYFSMGRIDLKYYF